VACICTGLKIPSTNTKTGPMAQTFILKRNEPPSWSTKGAGCSGCPIHDACYVRWEQAPRSVYTAYKGNRYRHYSNSWEDVAMLNTHFRVGAAGEPTKVPARVWMEILGRVKSWTGYTHKWKVNNNLPFRAFSMASVHSPREMQQANERGWRTYRVGGGPITKHEIECPHYTTGIQCKDCNLCNGTETKAKNIYAPAHGARKGKIK